MRNADGASGGGRQDRIKIESLYDKYDESQWNYSGKTCDSILQEFTAILIERKFERFLDEFNFDNDLHRLPVEEFKKLEAKIDNECIIIKTELSWWEYCHVKLAGRRKLILYTAIRCSCCYPRFHKFNLDVDVTCAPYVGTLKVPVLMDIMLNCRLFEDLHGHIETIVDAYLECDFTEQGLNYLVNKLKPAMRAFLDKIDIKLLPDKERFLQQLDKLDGLDRNSAHNRETKLNNTSDAPNANVSTVVRDLNNPEYINWVTGTLTLKYINEGARYFSLTKFQKFQKEYLTYNGLHFKDGEYIKMMCEQVELKSGNWTYPQRNIHCSQCKQLFNDVKHLHRRQNPGFHNCKDIPVGGPWGFAKLFMPANCGKVNTPEDADTSVLFQMIFNFVEFGKCKDYAEKICKLRNKLMHSPLLSMAADQLDELYDSELGFIEEAINQVDAGDESVRKKLDTSKETITQIRASDITVDFIEQGQTAMQFQSNELEKVTDREDDDANKQLIACQKDHLQKKQNCYSTVENTPSLKVQFQNEVIDTNVRNIDELRKILKESQKEKNEALESKTQMERALNDTQKHVRNIDAMEKTATALKEKQDALEKASTEMKEMQGALEKTNTELKETQRALKQTEIDLKEKQAYER